MSGKWQARQSLFINLDLLTSPSHAEKLALCGVQVVLVNQSTLLTTG